MKINLEKLESLLVKNWTEFISYKTLFPIIKEHVSSLLNSMPKIIENKNNIIPNKEFERLKEKHSFECFSFPRKIKNIKIEIIELQTEIEVQVNFKKVS